NLGQGTFSATMNTITNNPPGRTITATDVFFPNPPIITGTSNAVAVTALPATHFMVVTTSPTVAGTAPNRGAEAPRANNTVVTNYIGTVHFTSSDNQSVLPANYTFVLGDAGVHTFPNAVTLKTAGSQTVIATDTAASSVNGQATVTVNPAAATHFSVVV